MSLFLPGAAARADVLPEPQRPAWDEHAPPKPEPPPEKEIAWLAASLMIGLGALTLADRARRRRSEAA